jgi:hypothetical protein
VSAAPATIFGRIISGADVEDWCEQLIRTWISTYLAEKERQDGLEAGALPRPRGWVIAGGPVNKWPEDQLPTILLASVGIPAIPRKGGDGRYRARFDIRVSSIVSAATERDSRRLAHRYTAALRALFTQRPSLDGHADGVDWAAEDYDVLAYDDQRTLGVSTVALFVEVDDVTTAGSGPVTPTAPLDPAITPWPDWPQVQTVDVDVQHDPLVVTPTKEET